MMLGLLLLVLLRRTTTVLIVIDHKNQLISSFEDQLRQQEVSIVVSLIQECKWFTSLATSDG